MHVQHTLDVYSRKHQSPRTNAIYKPSRRSTLKRPLDDEEQALSSCSGNEIKRRSTSTSPSINMHQQADIESTVGAPSRMCSVCGDISTGIHFGGNSCESCKAFFRRSVQCSRYQNYRCSNEEQCPVNIVTRKVCQYCRYVKCTVIGMKPKWVLTDQERAEKYGSRRKRFRETRAGEEDPDIYKHLSQEEKLLIEDIAHALYQSRATYPMLFSKELSQQLAMLASGKAPPPPTSPDVKPPSPSANFITVPVQRFVLFARMLKDFDLFSEDDKVSLLKGSAIEVVVCSSNTLFNPKTLTFSNYLSRDQRTVMNDQTMPLDPILKKLWGEELFNQTKSFLTAMCNLKIDEVTSTLLVPLLLFSPDRSGIKDFELVKRLQSKYASLLAKYMNWRYGTQQTEQIYPKLLLQIVNIRTLGIAHAEIVQKVMATSSVNPLVQEVTVKQEPTSRSTASSRAGDFASFPSTPSGSEMMDYDKTSLMDNESSMGSDDDDGHRSKTRPLAGEDREEETEDGSESNPKNIWRKRRKLSTIAQDEPFKLDQNTFLKPPYPVKQEFDRSTSADFESSPNPTHLPKRPHDHQVPSFLPTAYHDDMNLSNRVSSFRCLPPKKQSGLHRTHPHDPIHCLHSSSANDLTVQEHHQTQANQYSQSPIAMSHYHDSSHDRYSQQYSRISPANYQQQQQNEQHLLLLSLANTPGQASASPRQSHPSTPLDPDEQQLLNAIHAHPNKRDLVISLLRQMNDPAIPPTAHFPAESNYYHQQRRQSDSPVKYDSYRHKPKTEDDKDSY